MYFSTASWTLPRVRYDITINKRNGEMLCSCPDASYRKKTPDFLNLLAGEGDACKHMRSTIAHYRHLLEQGAHKG